MAESNTQVEQGVGAVMTNIPSAAQADWADMQHNHEKQPASAEPPKFGHHPDPLIDAHVELDRLEAHLLTAKTALEDVLTLDVVSPNGLRIKGNVRWALGEITGDEKMKAVAPDRVSAEASAEPLGEARIASEMIVEDERAEINRIETEIFRPARKQVVEQACAAAQKVADSLGVAHLNLAHSEWSKRIVTAALAVANEARDREWEEAVLRAWVGEVDLNGGAEFMGHVRKRLNERKEAKP